VAAVVLVLSKIIGFVAKFALIILVILIVLTIVGFW
jgi:hypothetical protein